MLLHEVTPAIAHPLRTLSSVQRWALLARYAGIHYTDVVRYRHELREDHEFQDHLARARDEVPYTFPEAAELYVIIRAVKPQHVVETGVASGFSSAHILRAMAANNAGVLHSIDLPNVQDGSVLPAGRATGWAVPPSLRWRWTLQLGDTRKLLPALFTALGRTDVFLHDSDHSYAHMSFEFETALPWIARGGLMLSDDTHLHTAWDDFCFRHRLTPNRVGHLGITRTPHSR